MCRRRPWGRRRCTRWCVSSRSFGAAGSDAPFTRRSPGHGRVLGREWLWGRVRDDDADSLGIVLALGFSEMGRQPIVAVDPRQARPPGELPEGIEIVSLAERPELARAVWEVEREAVQDVPAPEPLSLDSFEEWVAHNQGPAALPAGSWRAPA